LFFIFNIRKEVKVANNKQKDNSSNPRKNGTAVTTMAGVAGAVVGAGVAVAATKALSNKKVRDRVKGTLSSVTNQVIEAMESADSNGKISPGGKTGRGSKKSSRRISGRKAQTGDAASGSMAIGR
jgi:hypothetical protein